jgi:hypothetical protein
MLVKAGMLMSLFWFENHAINSEFILGWFPFWEWWGRHE